MSIVFPWQSRLSLVAPHLQLCSLTIYILESSILSTVCISIRKLLSLYENILKNMKVVFKQLASSTLLLLHIMGYNAGYSSTIQLH